MAMPEYKSPLTHMWQYLNRTVYDFLRNSKKYVVLPAPTVDGNTVKVYLSAPETILKFDTDITVNFNLDVVPVKCKLGDKLYIIMSSTTSDYTITSTGALSFNNCGPDSPPSEHGVDEGTTIIPLVFDGTNFYGLDYC